MDAVFKKLNYKDHKEVVIVNAPESFELNLHSLEKAKVIRSAEEVSEIEFVMCFVMKQSEIDALVPTIAPKLKDDAVVWFCYPKGTSKKYKCDFNRDTGWTIMGSYNLEPVRMVAIDEDWSALRFRHVDFIKNMTRSPKMALSETAKKKTSGK